MPHSEMRLPADKFDIEAVAELAKLGYSQLEPVMPLVLEWMKDLNWPVAQALRPFLVSVGAPLVPHVRMVLSSADAIWKYWILRAVVAESDEMASCLRTDLMRLASTPTIAECEEGVDEAAAEILKRIKAHGAA